MRYGSELGTVYTGMGEKDVFERIELAGHVTDLHIRTIIEDSLAVLVGHT